MTSELSRLFAAERAARPALGAAERGLERLLSDLATQAAPLPLATGAAKLGASAISKWVLTGFVVGLVGSGAAAKLSTTTTEPAAQVLGASPSAALVAAPGAVGPTAALKPADEPSAEDSKVARPNEPAAAPPASTPIPVASTPHAVPPTFDAELRLISGAKAELDAGRPHLAKVWLDEHAQRFPAGVFTTDREALRVLASCSERPDAALARAFAVRHPSSPMLERLFGTCRAKNAKSGNETPATGEPTR